MSGIFEEQFLEPLSCLTAYFLSVMGLREHRIETYLIIYKVVAIIISLFLIIMIYYY